LEIRDALAHIAHRWVMIVVIIVVGVATATFLTFTAPPTYTSSSRLLLAVPISAEQAGIFAEAARAIVTSPSRVEAALDEVGEDDTAGLTIDVEPLGGSGIVQLNVTHPDRDTAAAVAGLLADELVEGGLRPGPSGASDDPPVLIEPAAPADRPDERAVLPNMMLGLIAGLSMAVVVTAIVEAFWPTLVSAREVARVVGAPALGQLAGPVAKLERADVERVAVRIRLAARYAGVNDVEVVSDGTPTDLEPLIELLQTCIDREGRSKNGERRLSLPDLRLFEAGTSNGRSPSVLQDAPFEQGSSRGVATEEAAVRTAVAGQRVAPSANRATGLLLVIRVPTTREGPDLARAVLDSIDKTVLGVIGYSS
jgi:capsular polysaccharide biosynthesis protein